MEVEKAGGIGIGGAGVVDRDSLRVVEAIAFRKSREAKRIECESRKMLKAVQRARKHPNSIKAQKVFQQINTQLQTTESNLIRTVATAMENKMKGDREVTSFESRSAFPRGVHFLFIDEPQRIVTISYKYVQAAEKTQQIEDEKARILRIAYGAVIYRKNSPINVVSNNSKTGTTTVVVEEDTQYDKCRQRQAAYERMMRKTQPLVAVFQFSETQEYRRSLPHDVLSKFLRSVVAKYGTDQDSVHYRHMQKLADNLPRPLLFASAPPTPTRTTTITPTTLVNTTTTMTTSPLIAAATTTATTTTTTSPSIPSCLPSCSSSSSRSFRRATVTTTDGKQ